MDGHTIKRRAERTQNCTASTEDIFRFNVTKRIKVKRRKKDIQYKSSNHKIALVVYYFR
jgi:hypothetical protein